MSPVSVLRIGPFPEDNQCAQQFRNVLLRYFHGTTTVTPSEEETDISNAAIPPADQKIAISNRYFTAQVVLVEIGVPYHDDAVSSETTSSSSEDGMILVFDAERSHPPYATAIATTAASFDALGSIHDTATAHNTAGELLRLCVGIGNPRRMAHNNHAAISEKEYELEYARRVLWCLDRGYEYVEVPDLSEESVRQGHDVRDKEGFARIVEAISGTVWTSAVMEPQKQAQLQESYQETRSDVLPSSLDALDSTHEETMEDDRSNLYEPPSGPIPIPSDSATQDDATDLAREQKARMALLADAPEAMEASAMVASDSVDTGTTSTADAPGRTTELRNEERSLQALEASLREARRIRELSQSGQLSDDERRQRAADAAVVIMQAMGNMGLYDDDDDSVGEDDEDNEGNEDNEGSNQ